MSMKVFNREQGEAPEPVVSVAFWVAMCAILCPCLLTLFVVAFYWLPK